MPTCKKCGCEFPNRVIIEGKERFLRNRKYCLDCSPFGSRNTKQIHLSDTGLICKFCGKTFDYKRANGTSHERCQTCSVNHRRYDKKLKAVEYKGGKCQVCGYNRCLRAMDFHHLDPDTKDFKISGNHCRSWEKIKVELDKCVLLCNRCHAEVHDGVIDLRGMV